MKTILLTLFSVMTFSTLSWASQPNPQIRQCNLLQGEFVVIQTQDDQIGLCKLGSAYIGSLDLFTFLTKQASPLSVEIYSKGMTACDPLGTSRVVQTLEGQNLRICFYHDGSLIEMTTLLNGKQSVRNTQLNQALGL